jgi:hypothetical protein
MNLAIYIDGKRLDLFKDETIEITSKLNDIEKLSNVFTDFSQSFTIPATANNNQIFSHYYDLDIDNTFNANIRIEAYLELNTIPFRIGVIQLESVTVKSGRPDNYKITFYGGLKQLSDLFGDDLISELDYVTDEEGNTTKEFTSLSQFDYDYNSTTWINSISNPEFVSGNIMTPLIAYSDRDWGVKTANVLNDITNNTGSINDTELKPSIRINNILNAIETKYDITFSNDFTNKSVFQNIYMWLNNENLFTTTRTLQFTSSFQPYELDNETFEFTIDDDNHFINTFITFNPKNTIGFDEWGELTEYKLEVLLDDVIYRTIESDRITRINIKFELPQGTYQVKFRLTTKNRLNTYIASFSLRKQAFIGTNPDPTFYNSSTNSVIFINKVSAEYGLPELKVIDFLQGIMKMFKLIIRPITTNSFYLDSIDSFYNKGNLINITDYVDIEDITYSRPLIYKELKFKFEETNNVLGKKFRESNNNVGYGDLKARYPQVQGENLEIKLPFENMLWENLPYETGADQGNLSNIVIGQSISVDENGVISKNNSKPILFYNTGIIKASEFIKFKFLNDIAETTYYQLCLNIDDQLLNQVNQSLNWGSENDPYLLTRIDNSLYLNYWSNWINTIYDLKQRKIVFKSFLPQRFIDELSLNDRIIIGSNRFKIDEYNINLTTGETQFTLFKDIYNFSEPLPLVNTTPIVMNAGSKYFTISINEVQNEWLASVNYIDEDNWIEFLTPVQGEDNGYITFKVLSKAGQTPPLVYTPREAIITIEVDGIDYEINITQLGLEE